MFCRRLLAIIGVSLLSSYASAGIFALDSSKESHIRQSQLGTNQGQSRLIFGAQGSNMEFRTMLQFSMDDLVGATGGGPATINSVSLDAGDAFSWAGVAADTSNSFSVYSWNVPDFDVLDNTWNDPQGSLGMDGAGATLGTQLSTETFGTNTPQGDFVFNTSSAFTSFLQDAYDNYSSGDKLNFLLVTDNTALNTIPRTDSGSVTGIGTADLVVDATVAAVPEPSSLMVFSLSCGIALLGFRRKKAKPAI